MSVLSTDARPTTTTSTSARSGASAPRSRCASSSSASGASSVRGLNLGIDFEGGTSWEFPSATLSVDEVTRRAATASARTRPRSRSSAGATAGAAGAVDARGPSRRRDEVTDALAEAAGVDVTDISRLHGRVRRGAIRSPRRPTGRSSGSSSPSPPTSPCGSSGGWRSAPSPPWSHDLIISVGFYALFQFEVTPATVIAFLTILGYSLYDTIVVFDRMQENAAKLKGTGRVTYTDVVSLSLNQVLMRSLNTTICCAPAGPGDAVHRLLPAGSRRARGVRARPHRRHHGGCFSSVLIAAPVVVWLKEREPRYREIRSRPPGPHRPAPPRRSTPQTAPTSWRPRRRRRSSPSPPGRRPRPCPGGPSLPGPARRARSAEADPVA